MQFIVDCLKLFCLKEKYWEYPAGGKMTTLLKKAFEEISKLPETEQDTFARWMLEELVSEKEWEKRFANSKNVLEQLAEEALREHKAKETKPLDIDEL